MDNAQEFRKMVLENLKDGVIVFDDNNIVKYINKSALRLLGRDELGVLGISVFNLFEPSDLESSSEGKSVEQTLRNMKKSMGFGYLCYKADGGITQIIPSYLTSVLGEKNLKAAEMLILKLTSVPNNCEEFSANEQKKLRAIFEVAPFGMMLLDENIKIKMVNESLLNIFDCKMEDIFEKSPGDAVGCVNAYIENTSCGYSSKCGSCLLRNSIYAVLQTRKTIRNVEINFETIKKGVKNSTWILLNVVLIELESVNHVLVVIEDIDKQKRLMMELKEAKELAENASKSKTQFLANMSHEIRTPLNGINGMIDLTLLTDLNHDQTENLQIAKDCSNNLLKLINDLLDFSKIEAGKMLVENITFRFRDFINDSLKIHIKCAEDKGIRLLWEVDDRIPNSLVGDEKKIKQVIDNLVSNAIKFTENGYVKVSAKYVAGNPSNTDLQISVEDTGIGIATVDVDKLFQSFSQVDGSYTRKFSGAGLGLAISKELVEKMKGKIWVESDIGKGSIFTFSLHLLNGKSIEKKDEKVERFETITSNFKILVVEDDRINQTVMFSMLSEFGLHAVMASNGMEAVEFVEDNFFDVILMDVQMPVMDGLEATKRIREIEKKKGFRSKIIAVTAHAVQGDKEKFLEKGMDGYISKPIDMKKLHKVLQDTSQIRIKQMSDKDLSNLIINEDLVGEDNASWKEILDSNAVILKEYIEKNDYKEIERLAQEIKDVAESEGLDQIKTIAFRIQLSARKESNSDIAKFYGKIIEEISKI